MILLRIGSLMVCWVAMLTSSLAAQESKPNVIVILADDLGYADLASFGSTDMETPALDQMVAHGLKFTNFYANCPVCSPTRAALLTGCYQERVGVPGVIRTHPENSWGKLAEDAVLLPEVLSEAGYQTALIGKWHLGLTSEDWPNHRGFDHFQGFLGDMMDDYYDHRRHGNNYMRLNREEIDPKGHATDLFSNWACEYLLEQSKRAERKPFFLYLAYNAPHTPIQPPADWLAKVKTREPEMTDKRAKLVALIEHMDAGIGKVMQTLNQTGLANETLVLFTSDNGGQSNVGANNGPLREGKGTMYEGGLKVPAVAVWPGKIHPGTVTEQIAITMDLFPTICDLAGADATTAVDSISILPTLLGQPQTGDGSNPRDLFFVRREGGLQFNGLCIRALRRGDWKLVQNSPYAPWELFNLKNDPLEQQDLSSKNPQMFRELNEAMRKQIQMGGGVKWQ